MNIFKIFLLALSTLLICNNLHADNVFKWTDKAGVVHFSSQPPMDATAEVLKIKSSVTPPADESTSTPVVNSASPSTESSSVVPPTNAVTKNAAACKQAQEILKILNSQTVIQKAGKIMTIEEMNTEKSRSEQIIKVHC